MFNEIDFNQIDITGEPPKEETGRQYYYMAKLRGMQETKSQEIGRPVTYCLETFG